MISVAQQLNLVIGLFALIPTWKLFSLYIRTRNLDFIIFGGVFFSATLSLFFSVIASMNDVLIFYQVQYIFVNSTYFLLFWYSYRVLINPNKSILSVGLIWFVLILLTIIFWQKFEQPESTKFLHLNVPHSYSAYFPSGAGLKYKGSIVYSTGFRVLGDLFRLYAVIINMYVYLRVKPVIPKERLIWAKRLWITAISFLLFYVILILPWLRVVSIIPNLINLIGLIIIAYIALRIPEGLIISHAQMIRVSELYDVASKYDSGPSQEEYEDLISYMVGISKADR